MNTTTKKIKRLYPCCIHCRVQKPELGEHHSVPCLKCHPELENEFNKIENRRSILSMTGFWFSASLVCFGLFNIYIINLLGNSGFSWSVFFIIGGSIGLALEWFERFLF